MGTSDAGFSTEGLSSEILDLLLDLQMKEPDADRDVPDLSGLNAGRLRYLCSLLIKTAGAPVETQTPACCAPRKSWWLRTNRIRNRNLRGT